MKTDSRQRTAERARKDAVPIVHEHAAEPIPGGCFGSGFWGER